MGSPRAFKVTKPALPLLAPPSSRTRLQRERSRHVTAKSALENGEEAGSSTAVRSKSLKYDGTDANALDSDNLPPRDNGKRRQLAEEEDEEAPFRFLDLPAELRLHIYRMCLTRPHNIMLSKRERMVQCDLDLRESFDTSLEAARQDRASPDSLSSDMTSSSHADSTAGAGPKALSDQNANLNIAILRTCKQIYKEARDVLYSENVFDIDIYTAVTSLAALHQRSRRHIQHIELVIPSYTEILEHFSEVVRLSLRYCAGLKRFVIHTPFDLPGTPDGSMGSCNTTVYANGFDILRWLPQQCEVVLTSGRNPEIDAVVAKHLDLAKRQDKLSYARRQLISNEPPRFLSLP